MLGHVASCNKVSKSQAVSTFTGTSTKSNMSGLNINYCTYKLHNITDITFIYRVVTRYTIAWCGWFIRNQTTLCISIIGIWHTTLLYTQQWTLYVSSCNELFLYRGQPAFWFLLKFTSCCKSCYTLYHLINNFL